MPSTRHRHHHHALQLSSHCGTVFQPFSLLCLLPSTILVVRHLPTRLLIVLSTFSVLVRCHHQTLLSLPERSTHHSQQHLTSLRSHFEHIMRIRTHTSSTQMAPSKGVYYDTVPGSFAILINLGLDGSIKNMYSSHSHNSRCHAQQIWDPFNGQCRQLYCKDHYEVKDLKCVNENANKSPANASSDKPTIKFLDSASKVVNVTLGLRSSQMFTQQWITNNQVQLVAQFSKQFAADRKIDSSRIINVTMHFMSPTNANVSFLIKDSPNPTNDEILSTLTQDVFSGKQNYFVLDRTFAVVNIHTTLAEMNDFCMKENEMPIWFWNSDFTIITKENLTMIYVNKTGRIYYPGEYMGSVLVVESVDEHGILQNNVSSNAVVCEQTLIDEDCPRILMNRSEYEFVNGRHLYNTNGHYFDKYEFTDNQSVYVCLPPSKPHPELTQSLDTRIESGISTGLMLISITLLTLVLITFVRLASLRRTIHGFNSINLVIMLALMQISFLVNQFINECRVPAALFHFFTLSTLSWSSVIAYDMHRVFANGTLSVSRRNNNKTRLVYGTLPYLAPIILVAVATLGDIFDVKIIKGDYGPMWPSNVCWMRRKEAIISYFIVPVTLTVLINSVLYLRIVCNIRSEIKSFSSLKKVTRIPSSSSTTSTISVISSDSTTAQLGFNQTSIFTRLSVPLGFTWIIALFGTIVPTQYKVVIRIMSYLFIIANTSQGVTLFLALGVYKKIFARS